MNRESLVFFKSLFEQQRSMIIESRSLIDTDIQIQQDDLADEVDATSSELVATMKIRLRNREVLFLKKIDESLRKIQAGTFGVCDDCEDDIELKRLEARPTSTLCVSCKESQERQEHVHIDGRRHKSMGDSMRLRSA